jgi:glycosyltransferase involved in cell wall biosynthesis
MEASTITGLSSSIKNSLIKSEHTSTLSVKPELRVLQVFSILGMGGAETWLVSLLKHFKEVNSELPFQVKFDICLTSGRKGEFDEEVTSLGSKLYYLPYSRRTLLSFIKGFRQLLSNGKYHVIHHHQDYTAGLHFLLGKGYLPPLRIVHVHNPYNVHIANYTTNFLRKQTIAAGKYLVSCLATHIMGTSRQILTEYGFDNPSFSNIRRGSAHCGFDIDRFQGDYNSFHQSICREFNWELSSKIVLFVGRLDTDHNQKNPLFALEVARSCANIDSNIKCLIVGGGREKSTFKQKIKGWGLDNSIRVLGIRSDIPRLMIGADLLLFPSIGEGLGMVAVEAQSAGLRVLASTAVPRECVVIPSLVDFKDLSDGVRSWADTVLNLIYFPRHSSYECLNALKTSPFSIENSALNLLQLYTNKS